MKEAVAEMERQNPTPVPAQLINQPGALTGVWKVRRCASRRSWAGGRSRSCFTVDGVVAVWCWCWHALLPCW